MATTTFGTPGMRLLHRGGHVHRSGPACCAWAAPRGPSHRRAHVVFPWTRPLDPWTLGLGTWAGQLSTGGGGRYSPLANPPPPQTGSMTRSPKSKKSNGGGSCREGGRRIQVVHTVPHIVCCCFESPTSVKKNGCARNVVALLNSYP